MTEPTPSPFRALSQAQVDGFRRDGFTVLGKVLSDGEVEPLRAEYDRLFTQAREGGRYRNLATAGGEARRADEGAAEEMLQIMQMCERSLPFRRLCYDERILDAVEDLIGPAIQLFADQALFKPAGCGGPIHWHQDNAYWQCLPANLVSCWLTLDQVDAENGAMHVIPGSHLSPASHQRAEGQVLLDAGGAAGGTTPVVVDLPAGGAMFHHCQTLHSTPPNRSRRHRRAFAMHFMTPGTRSARAGAMPVSFARPLLRWRL